MFYNELRCAHEEHPVIIAEPPLPPKAQREKLCQIFFETFSVPAFSLMVSAVLGLYASGRSTGLAVDMGHGQTWIVPTHEGFMLHEHVNRVNLGGIDLTEKLREALTAKGYDFTTTVEREMIRDIKEKLGYVALNAEKERGRTLGVEKTYELPDGQLISVGTERFTVPEVMFQGEESLCAQAMVSLGRCGADLRPTLAKNVVLFGGNSLFPGLPLRVKKEFQSLMGDQPSGARIAVPDDRRNLPWLGGSILASLSTFAERYISKENYDEHGPSFVHTRCKT